MCLFNYIYLFICEFFYLFSRLLGISYHVTLNHMMSIDELSGKKTEKDDHKITCYLTRGNSLVTWKAAVRCFS